MELPVGKTDFVCVDYPAIVHNEDKMLKTIGGEEAVTKAFEDKTSRLELLWRPQDIFCKPVFGDLKSVTRLVLKVKKKKPDASGGSTDADLFEGEILGTINSAYKFTTMTDFQYLPMQKCESSTGKYKSVVDEVTLRSFKPRSWLDGPAPSHMLPPVFARSDIPTNYCFRDEPLPLKHRTKKAAEVDTNLIRGSRKRRPHFTVTSEYNTKEVPSKPLDEALQRLNQMEGRRVTEVSAIIKQAFEDKPIWSKNEIIIQLDVPREQLKPVLSAFAFFWNNGPWRTMWNRFGYDPRKDSAAKIYQTLDFRLRVTELGMKISYSKIKAKRNVAMYNLPLTKTKSHSRVGLIRHEILNNSEEQRKQKKKVEMDSTYIYRPDVLPPYRQMFYQLMYIQVEEIQKMVHKNDGAETVSTEKDGWLLPGTLEKSRELMTNMVKQLLRPGSNDADHLIPTKGKSSKRRPAKNRKLAATKTSEDTMSDQEDAMISGGDVMTASESDAVDTSLASSSQLSADTDGNGRAEATESDDSEFDDDDDDEEDYNAMESELLEFATGFDG